MKYFLHDTNSFDDEKITKLYINFGYEGLGLFYTLLEKIGKQEKPVDTTVLKTQLKVGKRLRAVLYRNWEQNKEGYEDFQLYYNFKVEKIITHYKDKLD